MPKFQTRAEIRVVIFVSREQKEVIERVVNETQLLVIYNYLDSYAAEACQRVYGVLNRIRD